MPITPEQFQAMQQRLAPKIRQEVPQDAVEDESDLHGEILKWAKEQHPLPAIIHSRMDKRSRATPGAPDFVIVFRGKVHFIEVKTRTGKRSTDQIAWALLAEMNGVKVHEVRSKSEFLEIVKG